MISVCVINCLIQTHPQRIPILDIARKIGCRCVKLILTFFNVQPLTFNIKSINWKSIFIKGRPKHRLI